MARRRKRWSEILAGEDRKVTQADIDAADRALRASAQVDYDVDGPTGCADDALPGTAEEWRSAIAPKKD